MPIFFYKRKGPLYSNNSSANLTTEKDPRIKHLLEGYCRTVVLKT